MLYENELRFLCDTFQKSHISCRTVGVDELFEALTDTLRPLRVEASPLRDEQRLSHLAPHTLYQDSDAFGLCYSYLLLPSQYPPAFLLVGPYLTAPLSSRQLLEMAEKNGVSPLAQRAFNELYAGIPLLSPDDHLFVMLHTFCERLWNNPAFAVVDVRRENQIPPSPINESGQNSNFDDALIRMRAMEQRYQFENELMQAVARGQIHKETQLWSAFSDEAFERRLSDPLRNAKNYSIIMNTLLRKAAEQGGVHPVYLDRLSSKFAQKIEHLSSLSESNDLMHELFRAYCRLVRKHSLANCSPVVQKTILLIDSDLSANLTLASLASAQGISSGYLSTVFHKETGKTVSEYIRERRIKHATHLLSTTHLQIQTVALHCGIMDVQYFSKIFKKQTGKTPKEYRESIRDSHNPQIL